MAKAAHGGHLEVVAGKLADSKATNNDVKKFGQQIVRDHGKAGEELKRIAQSKGVTLPEEPDATQKDLVKKLEAATGTDFDRLYISEAGVKDHEAYVEHDGAKVLIAEILEGTPADDFYDAKVTVLSEMIKHHVKEEEQRGGLFAQARGDGDVDLSELGAVMAARKKELVAKK